MKAKNKIHLLIGMIGITTLISGGVFAAYIVDDEATKIGFRIMIDPDAKAPGHYLYWGSDTEGVLLEKEDLPNDKYSYDIDISSSMLGSNTFTIKDHNDNVIVNQSTALTINFAGKYNITTTTGGYDFTYPLYFTNNKNYSNPKAFLFDNTQHISDSWPGNAMIDLHETNEFGQSIYQVNVDAKKYARSTSGIIFNDNGNNQTVDVDLNGVTPGTTGYYIGGNTTLKVNTGAVSWWDSSDAATCVYVYGSGVTAKWYKMTKDSNHNFSTTLSLEDGYNGIIFVRCNVNSVSAGSGNGFPPGDWNQTVDLGLTVSTVSEYQFTGNGGDKSKTANITSLKYNVQTYNHE